MDQSPVPQALGALTNSLHLSTVHNIRMMIYTPVTMNPKLVHNEFQICCIHKLMTCLDVS